MLWLFFLPFSERCHCFLRSNTKASSLFSLSLRTSFAFLVNIWIFALKWYSMRFLITQRIFQLSSSPPPKSSCLFSSSSVITVSEEEMSILTSKANMFCPSSMCFWSPLRYCFLQQLVPCLNLYPSFSNGSNYLSDVFNLPSPQHTILLYV